MRYGWVSYAPTKNNRVQYSIYRGEKLLKTGNKVTHAEARQAVSEWYENHPEEDSNLHPAQP